MKMFINSFANNFQHKVYSLRVFQEIQVSTLSSVINQIYCAVDLGSSSNLTFTLYNSTSKCFNHLIHLCHKSSIVNKGDQGLIFPKESFLSINEISRQNVKSFKG